MKWALMVIALLLLGYSGVVLVSEGRALLQLEDKRAGFANGSGFVAEQYAQEVRHALASNDVAQLREIIEHRLAKTPFDPLMLGLKADMLAEQNLLVSAKLQDQATLIAPHDPRVRVLRDWLRTRLQVLPLPASRLAE